MLSLTIRYGFSLIELLIVLAILGILLSFGFPLYTQYFVKANRLAAEEMLTKLSIAMEAYYLEHNTYQHATLANLQFPAYIVKNNYRLNIQKTSVDDYVITATPINQQATRDANCGLLEIDSTGQIHSKGVNTATVDCYL